MARIHYVKRAQQRYATKPVLDAEGNPVVKPIDRKTRRTGRQVTVRVTEPDYTKPLPNHKCDRCGVEIEPGMSYKWVQPKSGPYGGRKRYRCGKCPPWQVWELSSSLSARLAEVSFIFWRAIDSAESEDDVQAAQDEAAQTVRDIAEEKREAAQNTEEGFGHATSQSDELNDIADQLDSWADEIEGEDIPEFPEADEEAEDEVSEEERLENWREELTGSLAAVDESPV